MKLESPDPSLNASRPHSPLHLFVTFTLLALQGFGGVLAIIQREIVERRRWLTRAEFLDDWAVAQIMPGANIVNFSMMVGGRFFGLRGALAALGGMLIAPLIVVFLLALLYAHFAYQPAVSGALRGVGAVAAGLIVANGFKLSTALASHPLGRTACTTLSVLCFIAVALLHWPLAYVLFGLGGIACVVTYFRLAP